jgi:hypothetical protein
MISERNQCRVISTTNDVKSYNTLWDIKSKLPDTVRDAISLAKQLGFPYLWIDRLCIMQDDQFHQKDQIEHMAAIYNNANFTICATDGEGAEFGLRGMGKDSAPRHLQRTFLQFGSSPKLSVFRWDLIKEQKMKWYTRGWTFQERLLSTRRLVFNNQMMQWVCRNAQWSETAS